MWFCTICGRQERNYLLDEDIQEGDCICQTLSYQEIDALGILEWRGGHSDAEYHWETNENIKRNIEDLTKYRF